jgi:hypothetical protein
MLPWAIWWQKFGALSERDSDNQPPQRFETPGG